MKCVTTGLLGLLLLSPVAQAQAVNQALLDQAFASYGNATGGWYLNERCGFLDEAQAQAFEGNLAFITAALERGLGAGKTLEAIVASAKGAASDDRYSDCGDEPKRIVESATALAERWVGQIKAAAARQ